MEIPKYILIDEEDVPTKIIYSNKIFKILDSLHYNLFYKHIMNTNDKNEVRIYKKQKKMIIKDTRLSNSYSQTKFSIASLTSWRYSLNRNCLELFDECFIHIIILLDDNELQIVKMILNDN